MVPDRTLFTKARLELGLWEILALGCGIELLCAGSRGLWGTRVVHRDLPVRLLVSHSCVG
jgi:hypothetical protein